MEKLFETMSDMKTFEATVVSCRPGKKEGYEITLDRTAFFPEGGGQPFDTGVLGGASVHAVHIKDGEIIHYTDKPITPGETVTGTIDWERRFDHMQQHSGEHILTGLIHKRFGYDNVGFHMGKEEVTIDFNGAITPEELEELEMEANEVIHNRVPIIAFYPGEEALKEIDYRSKKELNEAIRIVEIPGVDTCACCGTHVADSGQVGIIKVLGMIHYKSGVRISMLCGKRAVKDGIAKQKQVTAISNLLSAKPEAIVDAVTKMKQEYTETKEQLYGLYLEMFRMKTNTYPDSHGFLTVVEEQLSPVQLRQFCTMLMEEKKGKAVLVCSMKEEGCWYYAAGSQALDMKTVGKQLNEMLCGKGGGSSQMVQGTFQAKKEQIIDVMNTLEGEYC